MSPGQFRLFLALVVVLHHSFPLRLGSWAVGLFYALSGYWIHYLWSQFPGINVSSYGEFIFSRWWRLIPTFLLIQLLAALLVYFGMMVGDQQLLRSPTWWLTQLTIAGNSHLGRIVVPAWSLDVEMQFYVLSPLFVAVMRHFNRRASIGLIALLITHGMIDGMRTGSFETLRLDVYAGFFMLGIYAHLHQWRPSRRLQTASVALTVAILALVLAVPEWSAGVWRRGNDIPSPKWLSPLVTYVMVLTFVPAALATVYRKSSKFDRLLGDLSYPIYLFHWLPRQWYYDHFSPGNTPIWNAVLLGANITASLVGGLLILVLVDEPMQRLRRHWKQRKTAELRNRDLAAVSQHEHR